MRDESPGGLGDELSRSDLQLAAQALRQDWPIPPAIKAKLLNRCLNYIDKDHEDGEKAKPRTVLSALKVMAEFGRLSLAQQALDLKAKIAEGEKGKLSLEELLGIAEQRAHDPSTARETAE